MVPVDDVECVSVGVADPVIVTVPDGLPDRVMVKVAVWEAEIVPLVLVLGVRVSVRVEVRARVGNRVAGRGENVQVDTDFPHFFSIAHTLADGLPADVGRHTLWHAAE